MIQTSILPDNKRKQIEIMHQITLLQQQPRTKKKVSKLQKKLYKLMDKRDEAKRRIFVTDTINRIAKGLDFNDLFSIHFDRIRRCQIEVGEIAVHFSKSEAQVVKRLKKLGVIKGKKEEAKDE
ncbi:DUF2481 family protein [Listeria booriae]|uniref:DUF2481 family protein n=1 Tax=Listeria booriae TaxID=1552123 RepID=A0A842AM24_9LIST|nr:DUF2481 family protein [Listeria booriae]MBC1402122.1 DUF2481 family protein [Listeria booriae]MBC1617854.1 DUF2481 family protein [Listeria booriae]